MTNIILYHCPGACSGVTMNALEEIGVPFETRTINLLAGQQKSAEYLQLNPQGKVPAMAIDGRVLTENAAILFHLHSFFPDAGLLPREEKSLGYNEGLQSVVWCSSTLHPMTRQVRMPVRFTLEDPSGVKAKGLELYQPVLQRLEERFAKHTWWFGETWSIVDVYLYWNYTTAQAGGLDLGAFDYIKKHAERVRERPSFVRALEREKAALRELSLA